MAFRKFDPEKIVQAIGVLLREHKDETASKLRILKMLYIADRECIKENSFPMFGSRTVAMDHGPLHSDALRLIDGEHTAETLIHKHVCRSGYLLSLRGGGDGVDLLSRYEIEKLQELCRKFAAKGDWEISHGITHQFAEWTKHTANGTSQTIPIEDIIDAVGRGDDKEFIMDGIKAEYNAKAAFGFHQL